MKNPNTSTSARKRHINLDLFVSWLTVSIRSRRGFSALLAWSRFGGIALICLRFLIDAEKITPVNTVLLGAGLVYSIVVVLFSGKLIKRFDSLAYHLILITIDTLLINYYVFVTGLINTDLYLLLFIPLATASHFLKRKRLLIIGPGIVVTYFMVLLLAQYTNFATDILIPWAGKSMFMLFGTLILRAQRSLPSTNESWVVAPSKARDKLEHLLRGLKATIPYATASIQLIYRDRLLIVACEGFPNREEIYQIEFPADDKRFPNYSVITNRQVQIAASEDYDSFKDQHYYAGHIVSWMGAPLISPSSGECFGMISIDSSEENAYNQFDAVQAGWFSKQISSFLVEAELGPAALTMATNRENLLGLLKSWAELLPSKTSKWDDDVQAAQELIHIGQKIFRTEDCSIFFLRHRYDHQTEEPVLYLIGSTAVPQHFFQNHEMKVTGRNRDGLTGYAVHRNRTLNYGAAKMEKSPYRANFTYHLKFLFSKTSRQVMITPLRDSKGNAIGALKIENRMGTSSEKEFFPVEKNLFEIYAAMVSLILETIRQRNLINRLDEGVHGLRGVVHHAAITPIEELLVTLQHAHNQTEIEGKLSEIQHTLEYVKMTIHGILSDSADNFYLEKEGLIHAVHYYLKGLQAIPFFTQACDRIKILTQSVRDDEMPYQIQEIFFNVAREGILNIVRHSRIEQKEDGYGEISLSRIDGTFVLTIKDNGVGFFETEEIAKHRLSFGLNDIKKQIELKKSYSQIATLDIESSPGLGTLIYARWAA